MLRRSLSLVLLGLSACAVPEHRCDIEKDTWGWFCVRTVTEYTCSVDASWDDGQAAMDAAYDTWSYHLLSEVPVVIDIRWTPEVDRPSTSIKRYDRDGVA